MTRFEIMIKRLTHSNNQKIIKSNIKNNMLKINMQRYELFVGQIINNEK